MTIVSIDLESFGSMIGGIITMGVGVYTILNQKGYIQKWITKLSIDDDVADVAKKQNGSALIKLSIPDELIAVFKDLAADSEGGIDAQRIIDILYDRNEIEKILSTSKPLTREEKDQIHCIMIRAMQSSRNKLHHKEALSISEAALNTVTKNQKTSASECAAT